MPNGKIILQLENILPLYTVDSERNVSSAWGLPDLNSGASRPMPKNNQSHQTEYKLHLNELRSNALRSFALYPSKVACPDPIFKCTDQLWFTSKNEII